MGIMTRIVRLCKADIHGVMDQIEDKALVLAQCLREMEDDMARDQARLARLAAKQEAIRANVADHAAQAAKTDEDLTRAIQKDKDDIARFLIRKLRALQTAAEKMECQAKALDKETGALRQELEEKRLVCERVKIQAEAFNAARKDREIYQCPGAGLAQAELSEEEIEWELEKRRESLASS